MLRRTVCLLSAPAKKVFETLRSQMDYESLLLPLAAPGGSTAAPSGSTDGPMHSSRHAGGRVTGGLPAEWVDGIAAQLHQSPHVGR